MPSTERRGYQTASYCVHSVPAHFWIKTEKVNSKSQPNSVGFYKHVFRFIIEKLWGLGKGSEKNSQTPSLPSRILPLLKSHRKKDDSKTWQKWAKGPIGGINTEVPSKGAVVTIRVITDLATPSRVRGVASLGACERCRHSPPPRELLNPSLRGGTQF